MSSECTVRMNAQWYEREGECDHRGDASTHDHDAGAHDDDSNESTSEPQVNTINAMTVKSNFNPPCFAEAQIPLRSRRLIMCCVISVCSGIDFGLGSNNERENEVEQ